MGSSLLALLGYLKNALGHLLGSIHQVMMLVMIAQDGHAVAAGIVVVGMKILINFVEYFE